VRRYPGFTAHSTYVVVCDRCAALVPRTAVGTARHNEWHAKLEERLIKLGQSAAEGEQAAQLLRPLG
jgi:hypothetical protein